MQEVGVKLNIGRWGEFGQYKVYTYDPFIEHWWVRLMNKARRHVAIWRPLNATK